MNNASWKYVFLQLHIHNHFQIEVENLLSLIVDNYLQVAVNLTYVAIKISFCDVDASCGM